MGDKLVTREYDETQMRTFTRAVLKDLQALELMIDGGLLEEHIYRIGAEQEMFLVDSSLHPAPIVTEVMEDAKDPRLTTEIGRFNIEANLTPRVFEGSCLTAIEAELEDVVSVVRNSAKKFDSGVVLAGILPTIQQSDLTAANLTPNPRYHEINRVVTKLHGKDRHIHIMGLDELQLTLQDTFIEFCNTSFQVHLQVGARDFTKYYNWAQAISAPVLAPAVNSPILLKHRLWHETRLALFQHATDTRSTIHRARNQPARVNFGDKWVEKSILEVLHEDAVRFRILLTQPVIEDSLEMLSDGVVPQLSAWRLHNGTIWRWNRACYGIADGRPSLRIEARFLPAGPSVPDEMANAAFFLGLMRALPEEFGDVTKLMSFDLAKANFFNVARFGLGSQIAWIDGKSYRASRLILEQLLPLARQGLQVAEIDSNDIDRLLGILEERTRMERTGSKWAFDSLEKMDKRAKLNVRMRSLTAAMKANQEDSLPLHRWGLAEVARRSDWIDNYKTVEQFMSTDLFTVRAEDAVDLAVSLMNWRRVRHVPVESDDGRLVGIVSHRDLLEMFANGTSQAETVVRDIMKKDPITVMPDTSSLDALRIMREMDIGCLPVVKDKKLIGLVTAFDYLTVSVKLLEERLEECAGSDSMANSTAAR